MLYEHGGENIKIKEKGNRLLNFILDPVENNINSTGKLAILSIIVISILTILGSIIDFKYKIRESLFKL